MFEGLMKKGQVIFMKKRIFAALVIMLFSLIAFCACTPESESGTDGSYTSEGMLYYPGSTLHIIYSEKEVEKYLPDLQNDIRDNLTTALRVRTDAESKIEHELVIGHADRQVSKDAYVMLSRIDKKDTDAAYVIYSDGKSVAIAYENDPFDLSLAITGAIKSLLSMMGDEKSFEIEAGIIESAVIDPIAYQDKIDRQQKAEKWAELRDEIERRVSADGSALYDKNGRAVSAADYADGVVNELQTFYSQYKDSVIDWFANLYEPAINGDYNNGGGFYYSNSGRNTEGYLPDIESTSQALNFIAGSGMARPYGYALPAWMREQIARFVKGAQAPNGYFYHIQWGQEMTDKKLARRGRDRSNAENILRELGVSPTYDTPNLEGDGIVINNHWVQPAATPLTTRLSHSAAQAVSKVIAVASSATPHLETKEALLNYLNNIIDIRNNCYGGGDELTSQGDDFLKRDKELKDAGADWSCSETVIKYLNDNVYESTGYWKSVVDYEGTNGLLKISGLYNKLGAEFPYPEEAARSAIKTLTTAEEAKTICFVYNAWYSIANITTNLRKYSSDTEAGAILADKISLDLLKSCQNEIAVSTVKNSAFRKDDGSYSYFTNGTVSDSHDMPVAVPQVDEGDVNATEIGIVGLTGNMFNALDLKGFMPPLYTKSDWMRYLAILDRLNPVIKDDDEEELEFITFDDEAINEKTEYADLTFNSEGGAVVVSDIREGAKGNVLRVETDNKGGDTLTFDCNSLRLSASCFVFEFDMFVESSSSGNILQVTLGSKAYMLMISVDDSGIHLCDISSGSTPRLMNDFGVTLPKDEWFNIKVEYYVGTEENVRIMVYANGELAGVTDNYYDSTSARLNGKVGTPVNMYAEASIFAMSYVNAVYYLDNVACYKTNAIYEEITDPNKQPNINIDAPKDSHVVSASGLGKYFNDPEYKDITTRYTYDFMGYPSPNLTAPLYGKMFCSDGMLIFERKGEAGMGETYIQYKLDAPKDLTQYSNYCSIYEFDYRVSEADLSYDNAPFRLDDGNYIRFVKNSDGTTWSLVEEDTAQIKCGEWANIRFEVYYINEYTEIVKIYVNGEYATMARLGEMSPFNSRLIMYMKKNVARGTVINVDNMIILHIDKQYVSNTGETVSPGPDTNIGTAKGEGAYYNGTVTENAQRWSFDDGTTPSLTGTKGVKYIKDKTTLMFIRIDGADESKEVYVTYKAPSTPTQTANPCTVIELDFYANAIVTGNYGVSFRFDDSNYAYFVENTDGTSFSIGTKDTAQIKAGQWHNIRFEIYYKSDSTLAEIYVDGVKSTEITLKDTTPYTERLIVNMKAQTPTDTLVAMDNVFIAHIDKEAPAAPTPDPDDPSQEPEEPDEPVSGAGGEGVYYNNSNLTGAILKEDFNSASSAALPITNTNVGKSEIVNGANVFTNPDTENKYSSQSYLTISGPLVSGGNLTDYLTVVEFDMKLTYSADEIADNQICYRLLPFIINGGSGDKYFRFTKNADADTLYIYSSGEASTIISDAWYNIRFEITYLTDGTATADLYVNNVKIGNSLALGTTSALITSIKVWRNAYTGYENTAVMSIDNIFYGHISDAQSGDDGTETEPIDTGVRGEGKFANAKDDFAAEISNKNVRYVTFDSTTTKTVLNVHGSILTRSLADEASAHMLTSASDDYIRVDNTSATAPDTAYITVSEFDMMFTGFTIPNSLTSFLRIRLYEGNNSESQFIDFVRNSDGSISFAKADTVKIEADKWFNLRFEIVYKTDGSASVDIYVNNTFITTKDYADFTPGVQRTWITVKDGAYNAGAAVQGTVYVDNVFIGHVDASNKTVND